MARAHFVKKARKAHKEGGIKKGESYYWWAFMVGGRGGPKHYSKTPPKRSQLTQSEFLGSLYDLEDAISDLTADDGLESAVSDIAQQFRDLGDEQEGKKENMPDALQDSETGQMLEQRKDRCHEIADELDGLDFSVDTPDKAEAKEGEDAAEDDDDNPWQEKLDDVQNVDLTVD